MVTTSRRAAVLAAAGTLGLGVLVAAGPAVAGASPTAERPATAAEPGPGWRDGTGMGPGGPGMGPGGGSGMGPGTGRGTGQGGAGMGPAEGMGTGAGRGGCGDPAVTAAKGTLTGQQQATLAAMAQEEKLAHDLYVAFAARYDLAVFEHIAASETRHLAAVRTLLERYGVADPTAGQPAGRFTDRAVQAAYARLLAQGGSSRAAALQVGQTVERTDIRDLEAALTGLTAPDVRQVYTQLRAASQHHLAAFQRWAGR